MALGEPSEGADGSADAAEALTRVLGGSTETIVGAIGVQGLLVPMPATVPVHGQHVFNGQSALDAVVVDDRVLIIDAWTRAQTEPIVTLEVHLVTDPERLATVSLFDVRAEHGVHVVVLEAPNPELVIASATATRPPDPGVANIRRDAVSVFLEVDAATTALVGWSADKLVGKPTVDFVHPDDLGRAIESWMDMRRQSGSLRMRIRFRHADGHYVWLEVTNDDRLDDPEYGCVLSTMVDISDEMAELEALHDRERLLQRLSDTLPIGICYIRSDRQVVYSNPPLLALLGPVDSVETLIRSVVGADRAPVERALERALDGRPDSVEVGVMHGYEERRCELTFRTMANEHGGSDGVVLCATDVTDRSRLRSELEHRASHDALSGCLNRAATVIEIERALRQFEHVTVAYIDVDRLKTINDELGHAAGDEMLRVAAARLRSATRTQDRLGRVGGDEFVVICPQGQGPFEAVELVERLTDAICGDVTFARQRIPLSASIGAAVSSDGERDPEELLSRADAAMYEVKERHRRRPLHGLSAVQT